VEDLDIIKENENYRVRLVLDEYPEKPYDEGATPILSREFHGYGARWEAFNEAGEGFAHALNELFDRFGRQDGEEVVERYLRIFHGAYSVTWDSSEYNRYVSFDTAEWREKVGLTDEWLNAHSTERDKLSEGSLKEVMAWANGDVYGYIVEKKLSTYKTYTDPQTLEVVTEEEDEEWVEVEDGSCYGFYGREWAEESAVDAFEAEVNRQK
jgi:hypothetical protein